MIDEAARLAGVKILSHVRSGKISPGDFERLWPNNTEDVAVKSVGFWIWTLFDDDSSDPIRIEEGSEEEIVLGNSLAFLSSGREFQPRSHGIAQKLKMILTGGVEWIGCELPWHLEWPFPPSTKAD
jgi:hypothetical protein